MKNDKSHPSRRICYKSMIGASCHLSIQLSAASACIIYKLKRRYKVAGISVVISDIGQTMELDRRGNLGLVYRRAMMCYMRAYQSDIVCLLEQFTCGQGSCPSLYTR